MECIYYVYMYLKENGTPFYVGKGKGNRHLAHLQEAKKSSTKDTNRLKINTIKKMLNEGKEPKIVFIDKNINEDSAFELEEFLISEIGRIDLKTGTLTNLTNGGDGAAGQSRDMTGENNPNFGKTGELCYWWGRKHTEETKLKMSEVQTGRVMTEEHKTNMRKPKSEKGRANIAKARKESLYRPSEETKLKLSLAGKGKPSPLKGRKASEETKRKISESGKGIPKPKKICPHCNRDIAVNTFSRFHGDNCKEKVEDVIE